MTKFKIKWLQVMLLATILASIPAQASVCGKPAADDGYEQLDQGVLVNAT
jgi:hypothetical protein